MNVEEQVEAIAARMFRNRFDQWNETHRGWKRVDLSPVGGKRLNSREVIRELVEKGYRVTAGYYSTRCRGFHTYTVLWKEKKR